MIGRWVAWSARHPWLVFVAALLLATAGGVAGRALSREVVPDLSDPQIAIVATWMGHPTVDVEASVTQVLTRALDGLPGSTAARGVSMSGMAHVEVLFESSSALEAGRRAIVERVAAARKALPPAVRLEVGPAVSSTSWVFQYALIDRSQRSTALSLRRWQDTVLRPALAALPGVAEVASVGGGVRQVRITIEPMPLANAGLAFTDVADAVRQALEPPGASLETLRNVALSPPGGAPLRLGDVANVLLDDEMPNGVADLDGTSAAVGGIVLARKDASLLSLVGEVKRTLTAAASSLPPHVEIATVYDRTELAHRVDHTLVAALGEEVAAAVAVILVFLLHGRSALVPLVTLPVVVLLTFGGMWIFGIPATIVSLGGIGIALGMAVDADVVALEVCHRRIEALDRTASGERRGRELLAAARSLAPAVTTSLVLTAVAFIPVFAFTGETGRLLRPLAATKTLVVVSAALVSLTLAPALRDRLLRGRVTPEFDNPLTAALVRAYRPFVEFALARPAFTIATAAIAVASCLPLLARIGGEFLPQIDEGDLLFMPTTGPGVPPGQAAAELRRQDQTIAAFPQVRTVFGKVGRADTATDPAPFSMAETIVRLKPQSAWPTMARTRWYSRWAPRALARVLAWAWPERTAETPSELADSLDRAARRAGWTNAWTAPARARMEMMSTGIRTPVGVRVVASDPARLEAIGTALRSLAMGVQGARSAVFESLGGETQLRFAADPMALAEHDVDPGLVQSTADLVLSGGHIGDILYEGVPIRVRVGLGGPGIRGQADTLRDITVRSAGVLRGQPVALALLGRAVYERAPVMIRTENRERVAYVYVDLSEGVDPVRYVESARRALEAAVAANRLHLRAGERIEWAGQHLLFEAGARRLRWIGAIVVLSMLGLLAVQFGSVTEALIVSLSVPFALVGSVWTLFLLGYPLSAPVWVGLLSVVGLATQTGVVMIVYIDESFYARVREGRILSRADIVFAHADGTVKRLRPKIMTIAAMGAALLPLLWSDGAGAEVMKRVAAPMIGGVVTSAFLTLEVLPVIYTMWRFRQLRQAQRAGVSIETVAGTMPGWRRSRFVWQSGRPVRRDA
jgi:Cu(I)/Ag(I) efflux system membrane protein CusA/SilA